MNVLVVGFMEFSVGSQRGINVLTSALAEHGENVSFFTFPTYPWDCVSKKRRCLLKGLDVDLGIEEASVKNFTKIIPIPYSSSRLPSKIKKTFFQFFEYSHVKPLLDININNYDMVIIESGKGVFLEKFLQGPKIIYRQSDPVEFYLDKDLAKYERRLIQKADLTLIVNQAILQKYQEEAPDLTKNMVLWENGFFVPEKGTYCNPYKTSPNAVYFGLFPINWEAIVVLANRMPTLMIHIFGPLTKPFDLPRNIIFHGYKPHSLIIHYMKFADVFIVPYEDIPERLALIEKTSKLLLAMYFNLPIIASPFSYADRLAKYGVCISNSLEEFIWHVGKHISCSKPKCYPFNLKDYSISSRKENFIAILKDKGLINL